MNRLKICNLYAGIGLHILNCAIKSKNKEFEQLRLFDL
jgi:hypothetical protein